MNKLEYNNLFNEYLSSWREYIKNGQKQENYLIFIASWHRLIDFVKENFYLE